MLTLAIRLLHDAEAARDIVHDVFESVLSENPTTVTPAYLLTGVRFACLKHLRNLSVRERFNNLYALDIDELEDDEWPEPEDVARLNSLIDQSLTEQDRRVVRMRFTDRMAYSEIAAQLGISEGAVYISICAMQWIFYVKISTANERQYRPAPRCLRETRKLYRCRG